MKKKVLLMLLLPFIIATCNLAFAEDAAIPPRQEIQSQETIPDIVKRISPSVVVVLAYDREGNLVSQGSGFFIGAAGDVITNRHVLEKAYRAEIKLSEDVAYPVKTVVAEDETGNLIRVSAGILKEAVVLILGGKPWHLFFLFF